jgi:bleomycin hydrolase
MQLARRYVSILLFTLLIGSGVGSGVAVRAAEPTKADVECIIRMLQSSALSPKDFEKSRKVYLDAPKETAQKREILQNEGFNVAALNEEILKNHNTNYSKVLSDAEIWNQLQNGVCWDESGCRTVVDDLIRRKVVDKDFSLAANYVDFASKYEKANKWLVDLVTNLVKSGRSQKDLNSIMNVEGAVSDGGFYPYFPFILKKWGAVPQSAMKSTASFRSSAALDKELKEKLAAIAVKMTKEYKSFHSEKDQQILTPAQVGQLLKIREDGMQEIFNMLGSHLGLPPKRFTFHFKDGTKKRFTPRQFAKEVLKVDPDENVVISSDPTLHYNKSFIIPGSRMAVQRPTDPDTAEQFLNVKNERLLELVKESIDKGHVVWFGADADQSMMVMSRKDPRFAGIMHPDLFKTDDIYNMPDPAQFPKITNPKLLRLLGLSQEDHAMVIVGYDMDENGKIIKLKVANSWGKEVGTLGYFHMYPEWFQKFVTEIVVPKKILKAPERRVLAKPRISLE